MALCFSKRAIHPAQRKRHPQTPSDPSVPNTSRMSNSIPVLDQFKLTGKTALITGGNGGIGAAMATALAEAGADIIIIQIPNDTSDFHKSITSLSRKVGVYDCDLAETNNIRACVAQILNDGHVIDILVNCAGVSGHRPIENVDDEFREKVCPNTSRTLLCSRFHSLDQLSSSSG
jgi:NAD(P)-dependent dehydrogenase (short-subunit alcohol dehydrogenase family)